jgi:hypothetical protein
MGMSRSPAGICAKDQVETVLTAGERLKSTQTGPSHRSPAPANRLIERGSADGAKFFSFATTFSAVD